VKLFKPYDSPAKPNQAPSKGGDANSGQASSRGQAKGTNSGKASSSADQPKASSNPRGQAKSGQPKPVQAAAQAGSTTVLTSPAPSNAPVKKQVPTPTRRAAEQARRDRITPTITKKQAKARDRDARFKARDDAMAKTNALPYNTLIRDWVDSRFNLAEFALPGMLVLFIITIASSYFWPPLALVAPYALWVVIAAVVIDVVIMWIGLRRQLKLHFPKEPLKGKLSYALSRMMLMRRSRVPEPRLKRSDKFIWPPAHGSH
jgi:hypothetical protein